MQTNLATTRPEALARIIHWCWRSSDTLFQAFGAIRKPAHRQSGIEQAVYATLTQEETRTPDLGGKATTGEFGRAVISRIRGSH